MHRIPQKERNLVENEALKTIKNVQKGNKIRKKINQWEKSTVKDQDTNFKNSSDFVSEKGQKVRNKSLNLAELDNQNDGKTCLGMTN